MEIILETHSSQNSYLIPTHIVLFLPNDPLPLFLMIKEPYFKIIASSTYPKMKNSSTITMQENFPPFN